MIEEGESPDHTAQRELQEETGYASRNLRALGGIYSSPGFCDEILYIYLARDLVESKLPEDDDEDITLERVPMSDVGRLIRLGEIQDAKSVAGTADGPIPILIHPGRYPAISRLRRHLPSFPLSRESIPVDCSLVVWNVLLSNANRT